MIDQLRALITGWHDEADQNADLLRHAVAETYRECANELAALLPPPQPPDAYTNIPFVSVAEADQYAKEHTR